MPGIENDSPFPCPPILALFQKRIDGDEALLHLARLRFREAGLGTEFYATTPMELNGLLKFRPGPKTPAVAHLRRDINLFEGQDRNLIIDFATKFKGQVLGLVIHDQSEIMARPDDYVAALHEIESGLKKIQGSPYLFVEYAVGLEPDLFVEIFKTIQDLKYVSACIDIGHVGTWQVRSAYSRKHPGRDVCAITPNNPGLPEVIRDVQCAVESGLDRVLNVIQALGHLGKPLHFHLHDGHPLSTFSPFGVSDHLSFLVEIPIPFEYKGKMSLDPMFGPSGLSRIVTESLQLLGPDRVSFTLEIHPTEGRLPLANASYLFDHWRDKTNAEKMNYWLSILAQNHKLLIEAYKNSILTLTDK
ncbi:MAG: hypothetical protein GWP10_09665 [Nitrospiraceae bacterium]|nr:hypothetical protein [Nitrospiraceae bacterium]